MRWIAWRRSTSASIKEVMVCLSLSHNVWTNLAFEDWVYENVDLTKRQILFFWSNLPCVVIGRHQNPWLECNVSELRRSNVPVVRRRSGGGAVYHDLGNLNLTMFTSRQDYDRRRNLELVTTALNKRWNTELLVTNRHDIICRDIWKVSGSSSKLGKNSAYHHFTLLLNSSLDSLRYSLSPNPLFSLTESSSTESIRSEVANLCDIYPRLDYEQVCKAISEDFYSAHGVKDGKIVEIEPDDEVDRPGISSLYLQLKEWEWVFGKTPKFALSSRIHLEDHSIDMELEVSKGRIQNCRFSNGSGKIDFFKLQQALIGCCLGQSLEHQLITMMSSPQTHPISKSILKWINTNF